MRTAGELFDDLAADLKALTDREAEVTRLGLLANSPVAIPSALQQSLYQVVEAIWADLRPWYEDGVDPYLPARDREDLLELARLEALDELRELIDSVPLEVDA